jgi:pyridoxal phosphate enzyme (YggS family)
MIKIKENIREIKLKMEEAAARGGVDPEDLTLVAVTKTRTPEEINAAIDCGITDIGENKVQEIVSKYDSIKPVRWHMIGHLQTNKVKYIIDKVDLIHSVDSLKLAAEISKRAARHDKVMDILIQINVALEESKFGINKDETDELIHDILKSCPNVQIKGFMCMAPLLDDEEAVRGYFREVSSIYQRCGSIKHERMNLKHLSMGMSGDYPLALEEGANTVRIGTSIFGERKYNHN